METPKQNTPTNQTTKNDSSDAARVKQHQTSPPPKPNKPETNRSKEEEDAQKGHS